MREWKEDHQLTACFVGKYRMNSTACDPELRLKDLFENSGAKLTGLLGFPPQNKTRKGLLIDACPYKDMYSMLVYIEYG